MFEFHSSYSAYPACRETEKDVDLQRDKGLNGLFCIEEYCRKLKEGSMLI